MFSIIYNQEEPPSFFRKSVYLAGTNQGSWRDKAIDLLKDDFSNGGVIFCPQNNPNPNSKLKYPSPDNKEEYSKQINWERTWLNSSDAVIFWLPRDLENIGLISNVEFGELVNSGRIFCGSPKESEDKDKNSYLRSVIENKGIKWYDNLEDLVKDTIDFIGRGSIREKADRKIPMKIWKHDSFRNWKKDIEENELNCSIKDYEILFNVYDAENKELFLWAVKPTIHIGKEKRNKDCEIVMGRTEGTSICVYEENKNIEDTRIVLVKEFRSANRSKDGYVLELPSGAIHEDESDAQSSLVELKEETGISFNTVNKNRVKFVGYRQSLPTLIANCDKAYKIGISSIEMDNIENITKNKTFGIKEETEITYVEVKTFKEILQEDRVDWKTLGIISKCLL